MEVWKAEQFQPAFRSRNSLRRVVSPAIKRTNAQPTIFGFKFAWVRLKLNECTGLFNEWLTIPEKARLK